MSVVFRLALFKVEPKSDTSICAWLNPTLTNCMWAVYLLVLLAHRLIESGRALWACLRNLLSNTSQKIALNPLTTKRTFNVKRSRKSRYPQVIHNAMHWQICQPAVSWCNFHSPLFRVQSVGHCIRRNHHSLTKDPAAFSRSWAVCARWLDVRRKRLG